MLSGITMDDYRHKMSFSPSGRILYINYTSDGKKIDELEFLARIDYSHHFINNIFNQKQDLALVDLSNCKITKRVRNTFSDPETIDADKKFTKTAYIVDEALVSAILFNFKSRVTFSNKKAFNPDEKMKAIEWLLR